MRLMGVSSLCYCFFQGHRLKRVAAVLSHSLAESPVCGILTLKSLLTVLVSPKCLESVKIHILSIV